MPKTNSRPYEPDPQRTHTPGSAYGAEWYGSAEDICRVHAALQHNAVGPAAPVKDILSEIAGIDLDRTEWPYIGAKAGNLPGDLTFSWYAVDRTGQAWVVSFQLNWPRFHSPNAGGWADDDHQAGLRPAAALPLTPSAASSGPRKCITVRLTGAMSMRQNDFGGAVECNQDGGADHRRMSDRHQPRGAAG